MKDEDLDVEYYYKILLQKALEDDIISQEEQAMLDTIMEQFDNYTKLLDKSLEDGIITAKEKVELYKFRTGIFGESLKTASEHDDVSDAEAKLLNVLIKVLSELGKYEDKFKEKDEVELVF